MNKETSIEIEKDTQLEEIVSRLAKGFHPDKIYLFGSRARGGKDPYSDYDILVVMPTLSEPAFRYSQRAYEVLSGITAPKDILFLSQEKFEYWKDTVGTLAELVSREGMELYAAA